MSSLYDDLPEPGAPQASSSKSSVPIWAVPRTARSDATAKAKMQSLEAKRKKTEEEKKVKPPKAATSTPAFTPLPRQALIGNIPRALMAKRKLKGANIAHLKRAKAAKATVTNVHDAHDTQASSGTDSKQWPFGDRIIDEYDPAKPNDYEEFTKMRDNKYEKEAVERRNRKAKEKLKKQYEKQETNVDQGETGEEAYLRRVRMSQKPNTGSSGGNSANPPSRGQGTSQNDVGRPSRVVLLTNMVAPGEVDDDLAGETAEECQKYGPVLKCSITEVNRVGIKEEEAVRIFVVFGTVDAATKALKDLNGRFFAGRTVRARYFPVDKFNRNELEP